jgi:hypothetical protein
MAVSTAHWTAADSVCQTVAWWEVLWVANWAELKADRLVVLRVMSTVERLEGCWVAARDGTWAAWKALQWVAHWEQKWVDKLEGMKADRKGNRTAEQKAGATARRLVD